jgi:putative membrane protein
MLGFIIGAIVAGIAFLVTAQVLPSITVGDDIPALAITVVTFGLVNALVKPIVKLLSLPLQWATLGLIGLIINGGLLLLTAWIAGQLDNEFAIAGFPPDLSIEAVGTAIVGALIISVVTTVVGLVVKD